MFDSPLFLLKIICVFALVNARPRVYRQTGSGITTCPIKEQRRTPGTITSPRHPGQYPNNSTCSWIIAAPKNAVVYFEFSAFDIKSGPLCGALKCKCDYVQIREAKKTLPKVIEKFCEGRLPKGVIQTSSSRVRVIFRSDMTGQANGFALKFWFVYTTTIPPSIPNITGTTPLVATNQLNATVVNLIPIATSGNTVPPTEQTKTVNPLLVINGPTKPDPTSPQQVYTSTTELKYGISPVPSERYAPISRPIKARSTQLQDEPGPAPRITNRATSTNNDTVPVVMFFENKEKAKKAEEEADPPDAIVLGPSIPIILIFIGVVAAIAWWKFRSDKKERLRYYKEQISRFGEIIHRIEIWPPLHFHNFQNSLFKYEEISKRKRLFKKKQSMRDIRTKRLYSDMTRSWQGRSQSTSSPITSKTKRSFAGRLLELAEKPVSYIKTPRSSRPSSLVLQEQSSPLVVLREKKDKPESGSRLDPGNRPPSRPASMLLRDALNMIFGTTSAQTSSDSASETPKDSGSGNTSKRGSKRVSFYDVLIEKMAEVKESEDESKTDIKDQADQSKLAPVSVPHIMVRQPSYESGDDIELSRRSPTPKSPTISEGKKGPVSGDTEEKEKPFRRHTEPTGDKGTAVETDAPVSQTDDIDPRVTQVDETDPRDKRVDAAPETERPRSFDKKLVEMLEELQQEGNEREIDDRERDELEEPSVPPVPHQTPDPRDSASTSPTGRVVQGTR